MPFVNAQGEVAIKGGCPLKSAGEEKMEVAFKRDGQWTTAIYPRDAVFSSRGILDLSRLGCTVTSENARQVVKFLGALEAENKE